MQTAAKEWHEKVDAMVQERKHVYSKKKKYMQNLSCPKTPKNLESAERTPVKVAEHQYPNFEAPSEKLCHAVRRVVPAAGARNSGEEIHGANGGDVEMSSESTTVPAQIVLEQGSVPQTL